MFGYLGVMLGSELFGMTDKLSSGLQASSLSAAEGKAMAGNVLMTLAARRDQGDNFFSKVLMKANDLGIYYLTFVMDIDTCAYIGV